MDKLALLPCLSSLSKEDQLLMFHSNHYDSEPQVDCRCATDQFNARWHLSYFHALADMILKLYGYLVSNASYC